MQSNDNFDGTESPDEVIELTKLAERLENERPLPDANFRGRLGRELGAAHSEPVAKRARMLVFGSGVAGLLLLVLPALGLAAIGPFSA